MISTICTTCGERVPMAMVTKHRHEHKRYRSSSTWQGLRGRIIARDGGCVLCGTQAKLEVHHKRGWSDDPSNLITLCMEHHHEQH